MGKICVSGRLVVVRMSLPQVIATWRVLRPHLMSLGVALISTLWMQLLSEWRSFLSSNQPDHQNFARFGSKIAVG